MADKPTHTENQVDHMKGMSKTLPEMFRRSVDKFPDVTALMGSVKGRYQSITYRQMAEKVRSFGKGLIELGVQDGDHVALLFIYTLGTTGLTKKD